MDTVKGAFKLPFRAIAWIVAFVVKGRLLRQTSGAWFATRKERRAFLSKTNAGLLIDGHSLRLSETESYQNVCVIAAVGAGKTTRYVIPNVLDCVRRSVSIVIHDSKREIFNATSAALKRAGYHVLVFDPENPAQSVRINMLLEAADDIEIEQIAAIIILAGNPGGKDPFWNNGAIRLISILLKALRNIDRWEQPGVYTLANLVYLLQHFGKDGSPLAKFMARATIDPNNPWDTRLFDEWLGLLTGNLEGVQSFVLTALTGLRGLTNQNLAWITAQSDFALTELRRRKIALFIVTPPQHSRYYGFITSLVFRSVMNAAMRSTPGRRDLPIRLLWDEFGHATLPDFVATANTIRAYKVSLSVVLQSIAQLDVRYGREEAQAILGGFSTIMTYSGSDPETCRLVERLAGKVRERQRKDLFSTNPQDTYREYSLITANEVRTLPRHQMLVVSTNRQPVKLDTYAWFEVGRLKRLARKGACPIAPRKVLISELPRVRL